MEKTQYSSTFCNEIEVLRNYKRYLNLITPWICSRGPGTGHKRKRRLSAWQNPKHNLHYLFNFDKLTKNEKEELLSHHQSEDNPDFPWKIFAKSLKLEYTLVLSVITLFRLWSAYKIQPTEDELKYLCLEQWGDEASWLAFVKLGLHYRWATTKFRTKLTDYKSHLDIPAPIRLLAYLTLGTYIGYQAKYRYGMEKFSLQQQQIFKYAKSSSNLDEKISLALLLNKKYMEPILAEAFAEDRVYKAEIALSMSQTCRKEIFLQAVYSYYCPNIVINWLENFSEKELGINYEELLKVILISWKNTNAVIPIMKTLEKQKAGICKSLFDHEGNNVFWLLLPDSRKPRWYQKKNEKESDFRKMNSDKYLRNFKFLIKELGISPLHKNNNGFSIADYDMIARINDERKKLIGLNKNVPGLDNYDFWNK